MGQREFQSNILSLSIFHREDSFLCCTWCSFEQQPKQMERCNLFGVWKSPRNSRNPDSQPKWALLRIWVIMCADPKIKYVCMRIDDDSNEIYLLNNASEIMPYFCAPDLTYPWKEFESIYLAWCEQVSILCEATRQCTKYCNH